MKTMTTPEKLGLVYGILDTIKEPYLFAGKISDQQVSCHAQKILSTEDFCELMAGMLIATAQMNNVTPIKLLSEVGDTMSELMERAERHQRAKTLNQKGIKAGKSAKRK